MNRVSRKADYLFLANVLITAIVIFLPYKAHSRTELSGSIGGMILTEEGGPYIIEKEITVPSGEVAVIGEGCLFFFKPYTGIVVDGELTVNGTQDHPVLFTSINDSLSTDKKELLPNPFDWNGIHITGKAGKVVFSCFTLAYSVYGIKSHKETTVIKNGTFRQNGQYHFSMMDSPMPVADGIPYSYSGHTVIYMPNDASSGVAPVDSGRYREGTIITIAGNKDNLGREGYSFTGWNSSPDGSGIFYAAGSSIVMGSSDLTLHAQWKKISEETVAGIAAKENEKSPKAADTHDHFFVKKGVPALIAGAGAGSGIVSIIYLKKWLDQREEYRTSINPSGRRKLQDAGNFSSKAAIGSGAVSTAAIAAGAVLYWRWNLRKKDHAVVMPLILPEGAGAAVTIVLRNQESSQ